MALNPKDFQKLIKDTMKAIMSDQTFMESLIRNVTDHLNGKLDEIMSKQQQKIEECETKIKSLQSENENLQTQLDKHDQFQRRNCLRIFGIQESEGENTEDLMHNLINKTMKLKINVAANTEYCYRVGRPNIKSSQTLIGERNQTKPRAILIRFSNYKERQKVMENVRLLKGSGVVIREDLNRARLELLKAATNKYSYRNVWTRNGDIFANVEGRKRKIEKQSDLK
ncbi:unnamed protein product [Phaedon cochleariae]|uniref:Endonuclease-reverse transcriptase n=1 Tax=Phaedon cochleariae TaxID=80249 RepID=A0A9N9X5U4_PHACE|nr:unnamed protein product [Phaedon cochleariae]